MPNNFPSIYNVEYLTSLMREHWGVTDYNAADLTEYSEGQLG